jgi:hypothetical protein
VNWNKILGLYYNLDNTLQRDNNELLTHSNLSLAYYLNKKTQWKRKIITWKHILRENNLKYKTEKHVGECGLMCSRDTEAVIMTNLFIQKRSMKILRMQIPIRISSWMLWKLWSSSMVRKLCPYQNRLLYLVVEWSLKNVIAEHQSLLMNISREERRELT